ncbi:hypothetical protein CXF83_16860 [Shewanella sp. Choline-02u-19]|uniref:hypothetical protein n=1 Tax=unclassified Shewanella TaxID=196818 RepID=UPI000C3284CA|nr:MULTISPECIES: hypothetical protein [unclassified Shewanella]PKH57439.1 hypothetical protein CXF84_09045 [Shewanella sp. Bg11-22]PKI28260.1 hypothetical protein CXF83_16860 [Shewanella sp. Choline-02u-19]
MKTQLIKFISMPSSLVAFSFITLTACGGGGDGDSPTPAPVAVAVTPTPITITPPVTPDPEPAPDPTSLDDLVVDADNVMQAAYMLTINVDKSNQSRGYFSLCDDYQNQAGSYTVNFDSCLFRGPLSDGKISKQLKIANHESQLIAVIWFYEGQNPQYQEWSYMADNEEQVLTMN